MGCTLAKTQDEHSTAQQPRVQTQSCIFVPGLRVPKSLELASLAHHNNPSFQRLNSLHDRIVDAAEGLVLPRKLRKKKSINGSSTGSGSSIFLLREALEEYLPVLRRLLKEEPEISKEILFTWTNQEDEIKETTVRSPYYEMLSALQLLGVLCLLQANRALTFKPSGDSNNPSLMEESKKIAMDVLLNAAQVLECALKTILPEIPQSVKLQLPVDVTEGVLHALQLQALGQTVEIQLDLAIDNSKANMAVKRRLACEEVKYWEQAWEKLQAAHLGNGWGEKHILFVKWKSAEAKAAAYYYHGLILNDGTDKQAAARCLQASDRFFKDSERLRDEFDGTAPMTKMDLSRSPQWGPMRYLADNIPKDAHSTAHRLTWDDEKLPRLPDFPLALEVEEYQLGGTTNSDESKPEDDELA